MLHINLTTTRFHRLAEPEPLPEVTEEARSAFLSGWWGGICVGAVIGMGAGVMLLKSLGWAAS